MIFGENSEQYKTCKKYNDQTEQEKNQKDYNSTTWMLTYTEMLMSCIVLLKHGLYKPNLSVTLKGISLLAVIGAFGVGITCAYFVGKYEGIELRRPSTDTQIIPQNNSNNDSGKSTSQQSKQNHINSAKADSVK